MMYTLAEARKMLPDVKGCHITLDQKRFRVWKIHYPNAAPPYSVSKVYGCGKRPSNKALFHCLRKVWEWHTKATGVACPYDFSGLPA